MAKYKGIWAILMHKMMFPSESCNSVSKGNSVRFPLSRTFSPRVPSESLRVPLGVHGPHFGSRCCREMQNVLKQYFECCGWVRRGGKVGLCVCVCVCV